MGRPKKEKPVKGEKRVTKADKVEYARRVRQVLDWILNDQMACDIVTSAMLKWGVSDRQVYRYIDDAQAMLKEAHQEDIQQKVNYQVQRVKRSLRQMEEKHKNTPSGVFAIIKGLEHIAKIQGLMVQKIDHTTKGKEITQPVAFITYSESLKAKKEG